MPKIISEEKIKKILDDYRKYKIQAKVARMNNVSPGFVCKLIKENDKSRDRTEKECERYINFIIFINESRSLD